MELNSFLRIFFKMGKASTYLISAGKDPEEGKEIIDGSWSAEYHRGAVIERKSECVGDCQVGIK